MNCKITDMRIYPCILVLLICLTGCLSISRLNTPDEDASAPETEQAGQPQQQDPEEQKPPEPEPEQPPPTLTSIPLQQQPPPDTGPAPPEAVSIPPGLVETKLKQISYELNQISGELRQITQLLRVMSGVSQELFPEQMVQDTDRLELNERIRTETPTTIRPVFSSPDTGAVTAQPGASLDVSDLKNAANTAQTALDEVNAALERTTADSVETDSVEEEPAMATAEFELAMRNVTRSESADDKFGTPSITRGERGIFTYKDSVLTIIWKITQRDIAVTLTNTSKDSLTVLWADAAYIDEDSVPHAVIHDKITYQNTEKTQKPTELHPHDTVSDVLYPADYLVFNNMVGWLQYPLVPFTAFDLRTGTHLTDEEFTVRVNGYVGKTFMIEIPFLFRDEIHEYVFEFEIENTQVILGK